MRRREWGEGKEEGVWVGLKGGINERKAGGRSRGGAGEEGGDGKGMGRGGGRRR